MRSASVSAVALLFAAVAAASEGEGPFSLRIKPHGFDERCLRLEAGESIRYRFAASVPVDFNIHYHRGKDVFYPVRARAARSTDSVFEAGHADTFCLMWENAGSGEVTVDGTVGKPTGR
jgi:hypothetical protein